jgi:hypothetical protein
VRRAGGGAGGFGGEETVPFVLEGGEAGVEGPHAVDVCGDLRGAEKASTSSRIPRAGCVGVVGAREEGEPHLRP